jgi:hypothetical protein
MCRLAIIMMISNYYYDYYDDQLAGRVYKSGFLKFILEHLVLLLVQLSSSKICLRLGTSTTKSSENKVTKSRHDYLEKCLFLVLKVVDSQPLICGTPH